MSATPPGPWVERQYRDLMLHVRVRALETYAIEYEAREIVFCTKDGGEEGFAFANATPAEAAPGTADIDNAVVFVRGEIKFDGCSHNWFGDPERKGYYHGCQREHLTRLGPLFDRLYDWAIELIGHEEFLRPEPL